MYRRGMVAKKKSPPPLKPHILQVAQAGGRLDKTLTLMLIDKGVEGISRARIQTLLEDGHITCDGAKVDDASRKVKLGEVYSCTIPAPILVTPRPTKMKLDIVYEDEDIIVLNKPVGLVVHGGAGVHDATLVNGLLSHAKGSLSGIGGVVRPGIVHRLDKDTSGLMVVAKNDQAHQKLSAQFSDRSLSRIYHAIVWGSPMASGQVEASIGRHKTQRQKMSVTARGRYALTHYRVLKDFGVVSMIECKLATGRTHQIRVHLAHIGHAVVGDGVYGKKGNKKKGLDFLYDFPHQALHATELSLLHPRSGKKMSFKAPPPKDFTDLLRKLEKI